VDPERRPRDPRLRRGRAEPPDVEVVAPFAERLDLEQDPHQPARVPFALAALGRGVAVAEDQEVELLGRLARALESDQLAGRRRRRRVDQQVVGIDHRRPDLPEVVGPVALLDHHLHRRLGARETERLGEGAVHLARLAGRLPLAVDRREAARVQDPPRRAVDHLEAVLAEVGVVDGLAEIPRPRQRFDHHPLEREPLLARVAAVEVVDAQRRRTRMSVSGRRGVAESGACQTCHHRVREEEEERDSQAGQGSPHGNLSERRNARVGFKSPRLCWSVYPDRSGRTRCSGYIDDENLSRRLAAVSGRVDGDEIDEVLLSSLERVIASAGVSIEVVLAREEEQLLALIDCHVALALLDGGEQENGRFAGVDRKVHSDVLVPEGFEPSQTCRAFSPIQIGRGPIG